MQPASASAHRPRDAVSGQGPRVAPAPQPARRACVHPRIGLGKPPHGLGKIAHLARVDHSDGNARGLQGARQRRFVSACCLHHRQAHARGLQGRGQCRMAFRIVDKPLDIALGPSTQTSTCALTTSMPIVTEETTDRIFRSLACACALEDRARNRGASQRPVQLPCVLYSVTGSTPQRLPNCAGRYAASTAVRLYRAGQH